MVRRKPTVSSSKKRKNDNNQSERPTEPVQDGNNSTTSVSSIQPTSASVPSSSRPRRSAAPVAFRSEADDDVEQPIGQDDLGDGRVQSSRQVTGQTPSKTRAKTKSTEKWKLNVKEEKLDAADVTYKPPNESDQHENSDNDNDDDGGDDQEGADDNDQETGGPGEVQIPVLTLICPGCHSDYLYPLQKVPTKGNKKNCMPQIMKLIRKHCATCSGGQNAVVCSLCQLEISEGNKRRKTALIELSKLRGHMNVHRARVRGPLQCSNCGQSVPDQTRMQSHLLKCPALVGDSAESATKPTRPKSTPSTSGGGSRASRSSMLGLKKPGSDELWSIFVERDSLYRVRPLYIQMQLIAMQFASVPPCLEPDTLFRRPLTNRSDLTAVSITPTKKEKQPNFPAPPYPSLNVYVVRDSTENGGQPKGESISLNQLRGAALSDRTSVFHLGRPVTAIATVGHSSLAVACAVDLRPHRFDVQYTELCFLHLFSVRPPSVATAETVSLKLLTTIVIRDCGPITHMQAINGTLAMSLSNGSVGLLNLGGFDAVDIVRRFHSEQLDAGCQAVVLDRFDAVLVPCSSDFHSEVGPCVHFDWLSRSSRQREEPRQVNRICAVFGLGIVCVWDLVQFSRQAPDNNFNDPILPISSFFVAEDVVTHVNWAPYSTADYQVLAVNTMDLVKHYSIAGEVLMESQGFSAMLHAQQSPVQFNPMEPTYLRARSNAQLNKSSASASASAGRTFSWAVIDGHIQRSYTPMPASWEMVTRFCYSFEHDLLLFGSVAGHVARYMTLMREYALLSRHSWNREAAKLTAPVLLCSMKTPNEADNLARNSWITENRLRIDLQLAKPAQPETVETPAESASAASDFFASDTSRPQTGSSQRSTTTATESKSRSFEALLKNESPTCVSCLTIWPPERHRHPEADRPDTDSNDGEVVATYLDKLATEPLYFVAGTKSGLLVVGPAR